MTMMTQDLVELTLWTFCKFDIEAVEIGNSAKCLLLNASSQQRP